MTLPPCQYRGAEKGGTFPCGAAEGAPVTPKDCISCSIPEALAHAQACLYLVPMRHQGEGRFSCRWFFSWSNEPAVRNWRHLCFCPYWFPRPPREDMVPGLDKKRIQYLRVLRGEEPQSASSLPAGWIPDKHEPLTGIRGWFRKYFGTR